MGTSIFFKYHPACTFGGKKVLNLGCGTAQYNIPNVVNLDAYAICKPDIVWDLEKTPLPFKDEEFDLIIANHILEHLHNWWNVFEECVRICKVGGRIEVNLPGEGSSSQWGYRDHVSYINAYSFYGIKDMDRPATNAWAKENQKKMANKVKLVAGKDVIKNVWWCNYAPHWLKKFFVEHLRNIVVENRYVFERVEK